MKMEDEEKRLKNELESELKASLIDAFKKHKILIANFPLNIKIEVLRVEERNSLDRVSFNNKKLNVDLSLDDTLGNHKADIREEGHNVHMEDLTQENVTDEDDEDK